MLSNLKKLGYRYKGDYSPSASYTVGDVVKKDGIMQLYSGNSFSTFVKNQTTINNPGELLLKNEGQKGVHGQQLYVSEDNNKAKFQPTESRFNSTASKLMNTQTAAHDARFTNRHFAVIMTDGTVKAWGNENYGAVGNGRDSDSSTTIPKTVGFPAGTPSIVDLHSGYENCYAIDAEGGLWAWGYNGYSNLGQGHTSTNTSTAYPHKMNGKGDLPADAKVIKVVTGKGYYGYVNVMIMTEDRRVYFVGANRYYASGTLSVDDHTTPKLVVRSEMLLNEGKYVKEMFSFGHYHMATFLLDNEGCLWCAGEQNTIGRIQNNDNPNVPHQKMSYFEHKPIKSIVGNESDWHATTGSQYYRKYAIVFQDGDIATWGQTGKGTEAPSSLGTWTPTIDTRITDVKELFVRTSYSSYVGYLALKNDGTFQYIGYDGYAIGDSGDVSSWTALTNPKLSNVAKTIWGSSTYGASAAVLTTEGKVLSWGLTESGKSGLGVTSNVEANDVDYIRLPEKIVDIMYGGYWNGGSDVGVLFMLGESGTVWSVGSASHCQNGMDDDGEYTTTPNRVLL